MLSQPPKDAWALSPPALPQHLPTALVQVILVYILLNHDRHEQGMNSAPSHSFSSVFASEEKMSLRSRSIRRRLCASLQCQLMGSWWSGHLVLLTGPCCSHFLAGNYRKSISIPFLLKAPSGSLQEGSAPC